MIAVQFFRADGLYLSESTKIIIEVIEGTVLDSEGNGIDTCGYYVKYDTKKFSEGDKVQTVLIYNPDTNYIDDILYRIDTLI